MYMTVFNINTSVLVLQNFWIIGVCNAAPKFHSAKQSQQMLGFLLKYFSKIKEVFFVTDKIKMKKARIMFTFPDYIRLFYTSGFATL